VAQELALVRVPVPARVLVLSEPQVLWEVQVPVDPPVQAEDCAEAAPVRLLSYQSSSAAMARNTT
jgi:hypothetical protein